MAAHPAFPRQASRPGLDRPVLGRLAVPVRPVSHRRAQSTYSARSQGKNNREFNFADSARRIAQSAAVPNQPRQTPMSNAETPAPIQPRLINEKDAARYIGMSESFLRKGRMEGKRQGKTPPPPYLRLGRSIKYRLEDLDQWLEARKVSR